MTSKTFTLDEVAKHKSVDDAWLVIDGKVYDVTHFAQFHPGGEDVLLDAAGKCFRFVSYSLLTLKN